MILSMPPQFFPTSGHIMVCQGQTCRSRNSALLYQALWQYLEEHSLAYYKQGGSVRLTESGCLGACSYGPTLCTYRQTQEGGEQLEQAWYAACTLPLACRIAEAVHQRDELPSEQRYDNV